jgi:acyl carrier protein
MMTHPTESVIEQWLIQQIAFLTDHPADGIDPDQPMEAYGLTSLMAVGMSAGLEDWLGITVEATIVWDYPTVAGLAEYLASACMPATALKQH